MSWSNVESRLGMDIDFLKKSIPDYSYDRHKAVDTDNKLCEFLKNELRKTKDILSRILELSYKEEEKEISENIQEFRADIDIFLNDLETLRTERFTESVENLEKTVRIDKLLLENLSELTQFFDSLHSEIVSSGREDLKRIIQEKRKGLNDLKDLFKERFDLLKE